MSVSSKRQGKAQASGCWIRKERRLAIYLRDNFHCCYCGCDLRDAAPADLTLDHLTCQCDGGGNESANLVTACKRCNCARGAKSVAAFASSDAHARIETQRVAPLNIALAKAIIAGEA